VVRHIKDFIELALKADRRPDVAAAKPDPSKPKVLSSIHALREVVKELEKLDPRDFEPAARVEFLRVRGNATHLATQTSFFGTQADEAIRELLPVLDMYRGEGSGGNTRVFPYIADPALREIIERDYYEVRAKLFPTGAWKSTVVLAGSVLEAILFDRLADVKWKTQAVASPKAQHPKTGKPIPIDDWRLQDLIDIAVDIKLLPKDPANTIHQVLRDYRNFVHPKKEIRSAHACTEAEAMLAVGALDSVCNYIEKNP
jgi:hypothetical protein